MNLKGQEAVCLKVSPVIGQMLDIGQDEHAVRSKHAHHLI